jgi:DNA-binding MarR family transcriptional regulator
MVLAAPLPADAIDPLVVNPGRLSILAALCAVGAGSTSGIEFVDLRRQTRLTDGNLASHARRLEAGGLIEIAKQFRAGKPVTTYLLTAPGREALRRHVRDLISAVEPRVADTQSLEQRPAGAAAKLRTWHDPSSEEGWVD